MCNRGNEVIGKGICGDELFWILVFSVKTVVKKSRVEVYAIGKFKFLVIIYWILDNKNKINFQDSKQ